jgi:hypothetical protein
MTAAKEVGTSPGSEPAAPEAIELPERWGEQRKAELVLRVLRGETADAGGGGLKRAAAVGEPREFPRFGPSASP